MSALVSLACTACAQAHIELSDGSVVYWNHVTGEKREKAPPSYTLSLEDGAFILRVFNFGTLSETGFNEIEADFVNSYKPGNLMKSAW